MDRRAWWAAVHVVSQSQTRLKWLSMHACTGEGNDNPLLYSCLENPRDRGARWAAIYGVHRAGHDWSDLAAAAATTSNSQKFCFLFQVHWALLVCGSYFPKGDVCMKGYSSSSLKWKMRYPFQNFWPSYATEPTERKGVTPLSRMIDLYYHQDNHLISSRYHLEHCTRVDREDCL